MGLLIGARLAKQPVILSGGSQMLAVILLVLEFLGEKNKDEFIEDVFIATTGWLVKDNSLNDLVNLIKKKILMFSVKKTEIYIFKKYQ